MLSNADISDANVDSTEVCNLQFRSFGTRSRFCGPCFPMRVEEDHRPVDEVLSQPGAARVLVVDGGASLRIGVFGDRLAKLAISNGWAGLVINGAIRDSAVINQLDIGVKALGATALRAATPSPASGTIAGEPVNFGGIRFALGAWVYCDEDSVLVGPPNLNDTL